MKKRILSSALALGLFPLLLSSPYVSADFIHKQFACPKNGLVVVPDGARFDIQDIIISTNKNQTVTLRFAPSNRILARLFMKALEPVTTNFSGEVDSEGEQSLRLDCTGTASTTVTVTVTGNGNI